MNSTDEAEPDFVVWAGDVQGIESNGSYLFEIRKDGATSFHYTIKVKVSTEPGKPFEPGPEALASPPIVGHDGGMTTVTGNGSRDVSVDGVTFKLRVAVPKPAARRITIGAERVLP